VNDEPVLLTDDEVIALGLTRGTLWPAGLPTVDITSSDAVTAASFRGSRSLVCRGLWTDDQSSEVERAAREVVAATRRVNVYLGDNEHRVASFGLASTHHLTTEGQWLFEAVSAVGVHQLAPQPVEDHRTYLRAILDAAVTHGPDGSQPESGGATWLCITSESESGSKVAIARKDTLRLGDLTIGPDGPVVGGFTDVHVDAAVDALLEVAEVAQP
jgi:hypothetical protein